MALACSSYSVASDTPSETSLQDQTFYCYAAERGKHALESSKVIISKLDLLDEATEKSIGKFIPTQDDEIYALTIGEAHSEFSAKYTYHDPFTAELTLAYPPAENTFIYECQVTRFQRDLHMDQYNRKMSFITTATAKHKRKIKDLVQARLMSEWKLPEGTEKDTQTSVEIQLYPNGEFRSFDLVYSSEDETFNESIVATIQEIRRIDGYWLATPSLTKVTIDFVANDQAFAREERRKERLRLQAEREQAAQERKQRLEALAAERAAEAARQEKERLAALPKDPVVRAFGSIRSAIADKWVVPYPSALYEGGMAVVAINLFPNGEVQHAYIHTTSGSKDYDMAALKAVHDAGTFTDIQSVGLDKFERLFSKLFITVTPEGVRW